MKKLFPLIAIILLGTVNWSCDETVDTSQESPVYIVANWIKKDSVIGGLHYFFKMDINAVNGNLSKLAMSSVDGYNGKRELETIELSGTKQKVEYDFELPIFPDSMVEVELRAKVTNTIGETWEGTKKLKVFAADYALKETELNLVEIPAPGKYNGFRFTAGKPEAINTDVETEKSAQQVVIYYDKDKEGNVASKGIRTSVSNIRFARVNSFDYSNAKYNSVLNTFRDRYTVGELYTSIGNLTAGDVILVGTIDEAAKKSYALGVFKVTRVPETNDQESDIYRFLVKGMARN